MNETAHELRVEIKKTIQAPIEKVFDAWLDPTTLSQFILPMKGMPAPDVENDPREGGAFSILMHVGDQKVPHTGTYQKIDRPNTLAFNWVSPASTEDSVVTLQFTAVNEQETVIDLTHVKFISEEMRSNHEGGWTRILEEQSTLLS